MAANAIYFPHINVPADPWLLRMLLYWDRVSSIVPLDYLEDPAQFDSEMRDFVKEDLVTTLIPGLYLGGIPGFAEPFLQFAERWNRTHGFNRAPPPMVKIHAEKLADLTEPLVAKRLIHMVGKDDRWYYMPEPLANRFMAYLATALGRLPAINAAPVTDNTFTGQSLRVTARNAKRDAILEALFPMPAKSVPLRLDDLKRFKSDYGNLTVSFREKVERECVLLADGASNDEKHERIQALIEELEDELGLITEAMKGRWSKVVLGKVVPVLSPFAPLLDSDPVTQPATFAGAILAGSAALYQGNAMLAADDEFRRRPLAYVALARQRFSAIRPRSSRPRPGGHR